MAPKLRVLVSSPSQPYPPNQPLGVNSPTPTPIKNDHFDGEVSVWVKDFTGEGKKGDGHEYFESEGRGGMTYAIVVRGRFLDTVGGDELVWGNVFEKPIKDQLPWGTSIAVKAMQFVDPNVKLDIYADKPWALSPTLATFNFLSLSKEKPKYEPTVKEDSLDRLAEMIPGCNNRDDEDDGDDGDDEDDEDEDAPEIQDVPDTPATPAEEKVARKKWLGYPEHRKAVRVDNETWVGMEFCNGYLDFNTLSVKLPQPFTMSFPLLQYWDGQPVTYVCKRRAKDGKAQSEDGTVYFAVAFEIVDEGAKKALQEKLGDGHSNEGSDGEESGKKVKAVDADGELSNGTQGAGASDEDVD